MRSPINLDMNVQPRSRIVECEGFVACKTERQRDQEIRPVIQPSPDRLQLHEQNG